MASTPNKIIEYLRTIETTYTDCRVITELEMRCLVWFFLYGESVFSQFGRTWRGCTFRQSEEQCLLCVKSSWGDTQDVVFITARNPIDCVRIFCRKWHDDTLVWHVDRYA